MLGFPFLIAKRYLWTRRSEAAITLITVISILGIAIGVTTLNIVMAVMTGFQSEIREKILGADAHIVIRKVEDGIDDWQRIEKMISQVTGVETISPFTYHQALLRAGDASVGVLVRGISQDSSSANELAKNLGKNPDSIKELFKFGNKSLPTIFIGRELARSAGVFPGGIVSLMSPQTSSTPFGLVPRFRRFQVSGIYSSGLIEYESGLAYTDLKVAQSFFRLGERVTGFEVRVKSVDDAPKIAKAIMNSLSETEVGFFVRDWTETNRAFFEAMNLEKKVYFIVLLLIVVMASFSVVSSLIMVVLEKRKDIAILRTLGASARDISSIFRWQGAVIGATGVILGTILGVTGCFILKKYGFPIDERIFQMSTLPVHLELTNVLMVASAAFLISLLATIYPAKRASGLEPSEILRYE
jgi:lipoprotein-releasing system permease protein